MHETHDMVAAPPEPAFGDLVQETMTSYAPDGPRADEPTPLSEAVAAFRLLARLAGGELIEAGTFGSASEARARGEELAAELAAASGRWPWIGNGFVRPELVVALQVDPA